MVANRSFALIFHLLVFSHVFAQYNDAISIEFQDESLLGALARLDDITEKQLSFNPQILPKNQTVNQSYDSESVEEVLSDLIRTDL